MNKIKWSKTKPKLTDKCVLLLFNNDCFRVYKAYSRMNPHGEKAFILLNERDKEILEWQLPKAEYYALIELPEKA